MRLEPRLLPNGLRAARPLRIRIVAVVALFVLLAVACGDAGGSEVASLSENDDDPAADADDTGSEVDPEEAILEFAQCMRDNGVDFPDPTFDEDGNPQVNRGGGDGPAFDPESEEFEAAQNACADLFEGVGFGRRNIDEETVAELQDAQLEFAQCLRDEGLDVDDPEFGGGPDGSAPGGGGGRRGGPAAAFGLDEDDPEAAAALEECRPVLEEAFSGFGPGGPGNQDGE